MNEAVAQRHWGAAARHPVDSAAWTWGLGIALIMAAVPLLLLQSMPENRMLVGGANYLPFHTMVEMLAVVVAMVIFATGWHVNDEKRPGASVMLACAFLAVGVLDLAHLMSYQGMPDFVTPNSPHKGIVFWLGARVMAASALLAYALLPQDPVDQAPARRWLLLGSLAYVAVMAHIGLGEPDWVPQTFVAGEGLTPFKVAVESLVVGLHVINLVVLAWRRGSLAAAGLKVLMLSVALLGVGELFFMLYSRVNDSANVIGHIYKVVAYLFLYRAMFLDSVRAPIARLRQARLATEESERRYRELLDTAPDAILVLNPEGTIVMANDRVEAMFGYATEELLGRPMEMLIPDEFRAAHRHHVAAFLQQPAGNGMANKLDLRGLRRDGSLVPLDISLSVFRTEAEVRVTAFLRDDSERRKLEDDLRHQATHDALTRLPNRVLFNDRLQLALAQAQRSHRPGAVLLLDLDNFKTVNDALGHDKGDQLLVAVASRLRGALREEDTVARLGGDEFVVLVRDLLHPQDAVQVAEKIVAAFAAPFSIGAYEMFTGVSLGGTLFPQDAASAEDALRNADVAMYRAKSEGRGCARFFSPELNRRMQEDLRLQKLLKDAIDGGRLQLHYQPQIHVHGGSVQGVEALLRWHEPELGDIGPARFIPVAEASGLIVPLGNQVLRAACAQIERWRRAGTPVRVAVNLSPQQFRQRDLVEQVREALEGSGAPARLLELELTESAVMEDPESASRTLEQLAALGVQLAIDDFGTGYSSLGRLKTFPLHRLKIDRSFVKDVTRDGNDQAIVRSLVSLSHHLGLKVVAEGVETQEQLAFLRDCGCDEFQGWLFSRALPAEDCGRLLQGARGRSA